MRAANKPWAPRDCRLVLSDGTVFEGRSFGATGTVVAEVVFNTSLTGYQEIMSDPSYAGQVNAPLLWVDFLPPALWTSLGRRWPLSMRFIFYLLQRGLGTCAVIGLEARGA